MRISLLLASSLLLLTVGTTQAQTAVSIGPLAGLSATSTVDSDYRLGVEAGVQSVFQFEHWAIQPSLRFSQKGWISKYGTSYSGAALEDNTRLDYLTLPLNFAYSFRQGGQGFQVLAGPYVSLLLGGKYKNNYGDSRVRGGDYQPVPPVGATSQDYYFHRFDTGLQAGVGYRTGPFLAQADFTFGVYNLASWWGSPRNRGAQLSLSYLFNSKRN